MAYVKKAKKRFVSAKDIKPKPRPVLNLEFKVESKQLNDGSTVYYLKDSVGAICGIYDTEEIALKALPMVKKNIERGFIPFKLLKELRWLPHRFTH